MVIHRWSISGLHIFNDLQFLMDEKVGESEKMDVSKSIPTCPNQFHLICQPSGIVSLYFQLPWEWIDGPTSR